MIGARPRDGAATSQRAETASSASISETVASPSNGVTHAGGSSAATPSKIFEQPVQAPVLEPFTEDVRVADRHLEHGAAGRGAAQPELRRAFDHRRCTARPVLPDEVPPDPQREVLHGVGQGGEPGEGDLTVLEVGAGQAHRHLVRVDHPRPRRNGLRPETFDTRIAPAEARSARCGRI